MVPRGGEQGLGVIDRHLAISDLAFGLYWAGRLWWFFFQQRDQGYFFKDMDISGLIRTELLFSISRVMRLWILKGALERFLDIAQIRELVYYPCEYPLGRMISFVSGSCEPAVLRTGFQMSIASQRRLEQFLAPGDLPADFEFKTQIRSTFRNLGILWEYGNSSSIQKKLPK